MRPDLDARAWSPALTTMVLVVGACTPLDDRADGPLSVLVRDLPATVDRVTATISTSSAEHSLRSVVESMRADLFVESVPVGPVQVRVDAFAGAEFVGSRGQQVNVGTAAVTTAVVSFAPTAKDAGTEAVDAGADTADTGVAAMDAAMGEPDAGIDEIVSAEIDYPIPQVEEDDVIGTTLVVDAEGASPALQTFLMQAQNQLGRAPSRVRIRSATLSITAGSAVVVGLNDVFQSVELAIVTDTVDSTVGTTVLSGADSLALELDARDSTWLAVTSALLSADFELRLQGSTPRSQAEPFQVDLLLSVTFGAR